MITIRLFRGEAVVLLTTIGCALSSPNDLGCLTQSEGDIAEKIFNRLNNLLDKADRPLHPDEVFPFDPPEGPGAA